MFRKMQVFLQSARMECGLACLAMVCSHYGHRRSLREFRQRFQVSQRGTTLRQIKQWAEDMEFNCRALRVELNELSKLRLPVILHWEHQHYVVLTSLSRRSVLVADPALGMRRIGMKEVSESFTGVALECVPTIHFQKYESKDAVPWRHFLPIIKGLGGSLTAIFVAMVVLQVLSLVMPLNLQFIVDQGINRGDHHLVIVLVCGFGLVALVTIGIDYLRFVLVEYVGNTSAFRMVSGLARHMTRLPDSWFVERHTGDVLSRFRSTTPLRNFITNGVFAVTIDVLMALGSFTVIWFYAWEISLAVLGFLVLQTGVLAATYTPLRNLTHESILAGARENTTFIENIERQRAVKLLNAATLRDEVWEETYVSSINSSFRLRRFGAQLGVGTSILGVLQSSVLITMCAFKVIDGAFTLGMLFAFMTYIGLFSSRASSFLQTVFNVRLLRLHRERVADISSSEREQVSERRGKRLSIEGKLVCQNVSFSYDEDMEPVINALNLVVEPGEFVVVSGASGCGKSTLVKLFCGLIEPTQGRILVDGNDLRNLDLSYYRNQLGVIMQDDDLFSGSLSENISMSAEQVQESRLAHVAHQARIDTDIERWPMRYQTLIGHMGSTLSGGQKQRIMLARAMFRHPRVYLLDEGTAHLNEELQLGILQNLRDTGATVIAVTHDLSISHIAHRVIELP